MGLNFDLKVPLVSRVTATTPAIAPQSLCGLGPVKVLMGAGEEKSWTCVDRLPPGVVLNCFIHRPLPPTNSEISLDRVTSKKGKETYCMCVCNPRHTWMI